MKVQKLQSIYMSKVSIAELMSCSRHTVYEQCEGLEKFNQEHHRYAYPFNKRNVHLGVYLDWQARRKALLDERTRPYVPAFNPYEALAYAGIAIVDQDGELIKCVKE